MSSPRVSVVLPTYNRATLLEKAIESVLSQTFEEYELIIVDDASTDETSEVVRSFDDDRITYIRHEANQHGAVARNTGIDTASGEYVAFLDDDDEWYPTKLEKQCRKIDDSDDEVALIYCWSEVYDGDELVNVREPELRGDIFEQTLTRNPIGGTPTLFVRRNVLQEIGGFDESLRRGQDSDLVRRITKGNHVDYVPEALIKQRWRHEYPQITDADQKNLYDSIHSRRVTLQKFESYLEEHPLTTARIYRKIATTYAQAHDWSNVVEYALRTVREAPLNPAVYRELRPIAGHIKQEFFG